MLLRFESVSWFNKQMTCKILYMQVKKSGLCVFDRFLCESVCASRNRSGDHGGGEGAISFSSSPLFRDNLFINKETVC